MSFTAQIVKKHEKTKKKMEIWKPPSLLIIHLKRFVLYNDRWMKSNRLVEFPVSDLDPSSWLVEQPEEPVTYDLYGCVNHSGSLAGGHYTAYIKNKDDNKWYCFDDSCVKEVEDINSIVSPRGYLLFYKRKGIKSEDYLKGDIPDANIDIDKLVGKIPAPKKENEVRENMPGQGDLKNPAPNCSVM